MITQWDTPTLKKFIHLLNDFHAQPIRSSLGPAIGKKRPLIGLAFALIRIGSASRIMNYLMLVIVIVGYRGFRYPTHTAKVFEYGLSYNNIRAFNRLNKCLSPEVVASISINECKCAFTRRLLTIARPKIFWKCSGILTEERQGNALVHAQSVLGFAALILYTRCPLPRKTKVVCVANDHSPVDMALVFIANMEGRRTCYIQHAPVSEYFPPLSCNLSVLHNQSSVNTYHRAAQRRGVTVKGHIALLPPFDEECARIEVGPPPYKIGLCLSYVYRKREVVDIVNQLSDSTCVESVVIRPHPRCRMDHEKLLVGNKVSLGEKKEKTREFFDKVDIVLVPNSGIAVESLHFGKPTFFIPKTDSVAEDYYGFVKKGITPLFDIGDLQEGARVLRPFDEKWKERFKEFDETAKTSLGQLHETVANSFNSLLYK